MATLNPGATAERQLFVRNATGLVRAWSVFDAGLYAFWGCSIPLGIWVLSFGPFLPSGSLFWAIIICTVLLFFEILTYAAITAVIPRAGGDYVWQTRLLHGSLGFVLAATGWWFILWHWVPIYANLTNLELFQPLLQTVGAHGVATWLTGKTGIFVTSLIVIAATTAYISLGMRTLAKVQRVCFWVGLAGVAVVFVLLLVASHSGFVSAFNRESHTLYGAHGNAYAATIHAAGYPAGGPVAFHANATFLILGFIAFWLIYPNWGATLFGEVRGAGQVRNNIVAMGFGLLMAAGISLALIGLFSKTFGWGFYNAANNGYWGSVYGYTGGVHATPLGGAFPDPFMLAGWLINSHLFQFVLLTVLGFWMFAYYSTVFLSSTRVVFAAAFDRVLPEWAAYVSPKRGVPTASLALMAIPSIVVSALYAYWGKFATYTLDAGLVIVITYLGTAVAAMILPWRAKRLYEASPIARWKIAGIPIITVTGFVTFCGLGALLVLWLSDSIYGVNNTSSLIYMGILYALAIVIYVAARLVRWRQGISLDQVHHEIPVE
jgi:amino acid transporter